MRVLLADDHTLVRSGMRLILEEMRDMSVVGEAADGEEAIRLAEQVRPDVVLMDLSMPLVGGLEATRRLKRQLPDTRVLVLSMHADEAYVEQALSAGAAGYLLKGADRSELEHALNVVGAGQTYLSPAISRRVVDALARASDAARAGSMLDVLTPRQQEVLKLVAQGWSTKKIAAQLGLSVKTVEAHRSSIMDRLNIRDLAGVVRFAVRARLVDDPEQG
jgi:DNA-binding NarL/FixJ family response regulator